MLFDVICNKPNDTVLPGSVFFICLFPEIKMEFEKL
jgi:hypothetical protein